MEIYKNDKYKLALKVKRTIHHTINALHDDFILDKTDNIFIDNALDADVNVCAYGNFKGEDPFVIKVWLSKDNKNPESLQ